MRVVQLRLLALVAALVLVAAQGCNSRPSTTARSASAQDDTRAQSASAQVRVVTTFSTLNSFVEGAGGNLVQVRNLVPVGASPEDYQPTPQDVAAVSDAQLIVENGTGIETWLQRIIDDSGTKARILILSDGLPHIDHNPHLWMDPVNARVYVTKIRTALSLIDRPNSSQYAANARAYVAQLASLQSWIAQQVRRIPPAQRNMIIFHNAFDYYNRRFGIRTVGVIELSPGQDPNPQYIGRLVDLARANNVRAVFSEPEYSPKLAQNLAHSAGIRVVTDLYDDSIGNDPRVRNYVDMLRYDTGVIVRSLQ